MNANKKSCSISYISNWIPDLKSFDEYIQVFESNIKKSVESIAAYHIHIHDNPIKSIKAECGGSKHLFIHRDHKNIFDKFLFDEEIPHDNLYLLISAWPGREGPTIDLWLNLYKKIVVFGDLHHLQNPLKYAFNFLIKYNPDKVVFWSSIQNADFICVKLSIAYSFAFYSLKETPQRRSEVNKFIIRRYGSALSRFHPRRTYTNVTNQSNEIEGIPSQSMNCWFDAIKSDQIYLHTTLEGNFSHHILFPLKKGAVLLVDTSAVKNYYLKSILIPDKTCINYLPGQSLNSIIGKYDVGDLNEIASNGQKQVNHYFPDFPTSCIEETEKSIEHFNLQFLIDNRFDSLRKVISLLNEDEFIVLINLVEIMQEIHRFLIKKIPVFVKGTSQFCDALQKITDGHNYFEFTKNENFSPSMISIYFNEKPNEYWGLTILINDLDTINNSHEEYFDFSEHVNKFDGFLAWIPDFMTWPQRISPHITVI
jgi:hypothetical protein